MHVVYVAISVEDNELLGVYGSIKAVKDKVTGMFGDNNGWAVASDERELELLAPDGHKYDTLVVAKRMAVEE